MQHPQNSLTWSGEFRSRTQETAFRIARMPELLRHVWLVFLCSFIANLLFVFNDWRFYGQPHFAFAITARAVIAATSLGSLIIQRRTEDFAQLQRLCLIWAISIIVGAAVLVSPGTDIALAILFMLPMLFYLALPMSFSRTLAVGLGCSITTFAGFFWTASSWATLYGVGLAMGTINVVLALVLLRTNRLQRQGWAANLELAEQREMLQTLLRVAPAPLVIMDQGTGRLIQANDAARGYFGDTALHNSRTLLGYFKSPQPAREIGAPVTGGAPPSVLETETHLCLENGACRDVLLVTTTTPVGGAEALFAIVVDITERKKMEAELKVSASTDLLTGVYNRGIFFALAEKELRRTQRYRYPVTVVMIDIDHFKDINDTFGHAVGDVALKAFGCLCRSLLRQHDLVGRIGGEEFALLLPETKKENAMVMVERLRVAVELMRLPELPVGMTVSVGISEVLTEEVTINHALSRADKALYTAKHAGRNRTVMFE